MTTTQLTLQARASFSPEPEPDTSVLQAAVRIEGKPVLLEVRQASDSPVLQVSSPDAVDRERLREQAGWIVLATLDLRPFYRMARNDPIIGPPTKRFRGMKPLRPATLFEMMVDAVIEQQISLAAARRIRARVVERFGERKAGLWLFPKPEALVQASSLENLRQCGLSGRKAEYITGLARMVVDGSFSLNNLQGMSDDEVRSTIIGIRGFGRWSADYILIRGLGRPNAVPADDLAVRTIVGKYFGDGSRMTAEQVEQTLKPYVPFRGIAVFYLLVSHRLAPDRNRK
jgi:DNA-3-methyladenine glycosylase II